MPLAPLHRLLAPAALLPLLAPGAALAQTPAAEPDACAEVLAPFVAPEAGPCAGFAARCIQPEPTRASLGSGGPVRIPGSDAPPLPPPPSYKSGFHHAFEWLKDFNACRVQRGGQVPRPPDPVKDEFESADQFKKRLDAFEQAMKEREAQVLNVQRAIEPEVPAVTFAAILPASDIGQYDAASGCFFPGIVARTDLELFKSRDVVYLDGQKHRLIPREGKTFRTRIDSQTIAKAELDAENDQSVLVLTSHPLCVSAEMGRFYRDQREENGIHDFGIQVEMLLRFEFSPEPTWVISGDFRYRGDQANPETALRFDPGKQPPAPVVEGEDKAKEEPKEAKKGLFGCQVAPLGGLAASALAGLLAARRRAR